MKKPARTEAPAPAARKRATKAASAAPAPSRNILTAGIKALSQAHEQAVAQQGRVIESLLGVGKGPAATPAPPKATNALAAALDPFGFRKFEDVFDQRVARTLERLGYPSPEDYAALKAEVEALRAERADRAAKPASTRAPKR